MSPGAFAEAGRGEREGVEGAVCEAHVCDAGGWEVGGYFGDHFGWEGEEGWGGHFLGGLRVV